MRGIVGLLLKKPALRQQLGELMTPMLVGMTSRGPDSAGVAIFGSALTDSHKLSLFRGDGAADWKRLEVELDAEFPGKPCEAGGGRSLHDCPLSLGVAVSGRCSLSRSGVRSDAGDAAIFAAC